MNKIQKTKDQKKAPTQPEIEKEYIELIQRGKEQQPGINEILEFYGEFQEGFKQSQDYLQLIEPAVYSSTSNISEPA